MANEEHLRELLKGAQHWNAWVKEQGPDFRADLGGANFIGADLGGADLGRADLGGANLRGANLRNADLGGANLRGADLSLAKLGGADLRKADLRGADLGGTFLVGADLREVDLRGADLRRSFLREADLRKANLREADLGGADLREAVLREAVLGGADLREAVLGGTIVRSFVNSAAGTKDDGAAEFTDVRTVRNLTQAQLDIMDGDSGTIIPDDLTRPAHWLDFPGYLNGQKIDILEPNAPQEDKSAATNRSVYLLQHARQSSLTAESTAAMLETETLLLRQSSNQLGPEIELLEELVLTLRSIGLTVADKTPEPNLLEDKLRQLEAQVADLTARLEEAQSKLKEPGEFQKAFRQSAGKALGAAIVAAPLGAITGGLAYLLGAGAQATIIGFGTAAATAGIGAIK